MKYVTHTEAGEGLIFYGNVVLPFVDHFPKDTELYRIMTTKPEEVSESGSEVQTMKQLKPRDKITQKMTRDGAVEVNETQQTAERISSREADSDFSQPDTATARSASWNTLTQPIPERQAKRQSRKQQESGTSFAYFHFPLAVYRRGTGNAGTATLHQKIRKSSRQTGRSKGSYPEAEETGKRAHL